MFCVPLYPLFFFIYMGLLCLLRLMRGHVSSVIIILITQEESDEVVGHDN